MKYALRRQEIAMCSPEYVTEHILKSLNSYFGKQDNKRIIDDISQEKYVSPYGGYYSLLRINDLADDNDMLEFAVIGRQHDTFTYKYGVWVGDNGESYPGKGLTRRDIKVICWQPIPSFDEILDANRDVLERIKEKGD